MERLNTSTRQSCLTTKIIDALVIANNEERLKALIEAYTSHGLSAEIAKYTYKYDLIRRCGIATIQGECVAQINRICFIVPQNSEDEHEKAPQGL
ncbi:MAG: hypothetical protein N4A36_04220 [Candidatus Gracilibacteria bacterium]|jgi:hypothetical protein|nr:hypothetical protein [Candidatus Gracilibacteria bacterium]